VTTTNAAEGLNLAIESPTAAKSEVERKLRAMLLIRLLFAGAVSLVGPILCRAYAPSLYLFTGALFSLTFLYALLLKWHFNPKLFANIQIFADVFMVTLLIALTGWEDSKFGFLYIIPITTASLFFQLRESISIALLSSILYAATVLFHRYRLSPGTRAGNVELFYVLYARTIIFCMVGYLCGHLANMLKSQKEELRDLKSLRDLILSSMNSGLITTDNNDIIIYLNTAAENILGFSLEEMYNKSLWSFFVDGQSGSLEEALDKAIAAAEPAQGGKPELQARTADGIKIPIGFNLSPITNGSGEPVGKVMVFSDLTQVKELERRLRVIEKFRTASELAAGIAHEIRNPLTSITGSVEMLAESPGLSETNRGLLSIVLKESDRLNRIIEDFLAYAKKGSLDMKKENLCEIVKDSMEMLDRGRKLPRNVLVNLISSPRPAVVSADKGLMAQVFLNLLSNALDAVDGGGTISIRIDADTPDKNFCSVTVTDTGPGIPQEQLNRLFDPFFTTKKNGVGIGLCIAEKVVREHSGRMDIISEEGKGTSVTVVIPTRQRVGDADDEPDFAARVAAHPERDGAADGRPLITSSGNRKGALLPAPAAVAGQPACGLRG